VSTTQQTTIEEPKAPWGSLAISDELSLRFIGTTQYAALVLELGLAHTAEDNWATAETSLDEVVLDDEDDEDGKWRLLVLEDTGELLAADAKQQTGQGLSRLLNLVDGLVGQGLRVLVLVTTNEPMRSLHPAVARPGRCAARIEFEPFPSEEATRWLKRRGASHEGSASTLASMFATLGGQEQEADRPLGF
jgi:hypothetical protein